jgi:hypothetical protein
MDSRNSAGSWPAAWASSAMSGEEGKAVAARIEALRQAG